MEQIQPAFTNGIVVKRNIITVPRPALITEYNKFMGGVGKSDMLLPLYRSKCRTRKGYMRIFFHLCSLSAVNDWCIHGEIGGTGALKDFLIDIARSIMAGSCPGVDISTPDRSLSVRPTTPRRSLSAQHVPRVGRCDGLNHWPIQVAGKQ